jgi:hypothetical protein
MMSPAAVAALMASPITVLSEVAVTARPALSTMTAAPMAMAAPATTRLMPP